MNETTTGERVTVDAAALTLLYSAVSQINDYTPAYIKRTCAEAMATARPLPSREAVEKAVDEYAVVAHRPDAFRPTAPDWRDFHRARAALLALIYGDDATGGAS